MTSRLSFVPVGFLWPATVARTSAPGPSKYRKTDLDTALARLRGMAELKFKAGEIEIGIERGRTVYDEGVAIRFVDRYRRVIVLACDTYWRRQENLRAIELTLEAIWRMERDGSRQLFEQVASGGAFASLPPPVPWPWSELGLDGKAPRQAVEAAWRRRARETHPDAGGSTAAFQRARQAYEEAIKDG